MLGKASYADAQVHLDAGRGHRHPDGHTYPNCNGIDHPRHANSDGDASRRIVHDHTHHSNRQHVRWRL
jgi:hypothetical protein